MSLLLLCGSLLTYAACQSTHNSPAVDRRDPEAVLRAYFNAWSNNDAATQKSLMTEKYSNLAYEPVDSLRVLTIVPADGASPTKRVYAVSFEVTFKGGRSISMENGRYNWTYTLNWDATRNSWLISNYGAGEEGRLKLRRIFYSSFIPHIIGEATRGKPNAFGEVGTFRLPNSQLTVTYSKKFFTTMPGDPLSLFPEWFVELSSSDYLNGRDRAMEAILGP